IERDKRGGADELNAEVAWIEAQRALARAQRLAMAAKARERGGLAAQRLDIVGPTQQRVGEGDVRPYVSLARGGKGGPDERDGAVMRGDRARLLEPLDRRGGPPARVKDVGQEMQRVGVAAVARDERGQDVLGRREVAALGVR